MTIAKEQIDKYFDYVVKDFLSLISNYSESIKIKSMSQEEIRTLLTTTAFYSTFVEKPEFIMHNDMLFWANEALKELKRDNPEYFC